MNKTQEIQFYRVSIWVLLISLAVVLYSNYVFLLELSRFKFKLTCSSLGSYKDAQIEWSKGNGGLDRDKDGIACEQLK